MNNKYATRVIWSHIKEMSIFSSFAAVSISTWLIIQLFFLQLDNYHFPCQLDLIKALLSFDSLFISNWLSIYKH